MICLAKQSQATLQALYDLGCYYFCLPKDERDYDKSINYWKIGAEKGDSCAMYALEGFMMAGSESLDI
jgi:TPR repeat protein